MALVAISVVAFLIMVVGDLAGWNGFSGDETDNTPAADAVWVTFALTALTAFILGIVALLRSRKGGHLADRKPAIYGIAWLPLAVALSALYTVLD